MIFRVFYKNNNNNNYEISFEEYDSKYNKYIRKSAFEMLKGVIQLLDNYDKTNYYDILEQSLNYINYYFLFTYH